MTYFVSTACPCRRGTPQMYTDAYTHTQHIKREKLSKRFCKTKLAFYLLTSEQGDPTELGVGHHTSWKGFTPSSFLIITPTTIPSRTYLISAGTAEGFVEGRYLDIFWAVPPVHLCHCRSPGHKLTTTPALFLSGHHDLYLFSLWTLGFAFVIYVWGNPCVFLRACGGTWCRSVLD